MLYMKGIMKYMTGEEAQTPELKNEIAHKALDCDFFIGSTNALAENGVMVNIDGNANRVAAFAFGPKKCAF